MLGYKFERFFMHLIISGLILVGFTALLFEFSHMLKLSAQSHEFVKIEVSNFKECDNSRDDEATSICISIKYSELIRMYNNINETLATHKHAATIDSTIGIVIALITLFFTFVAWFGTSAYFKLKQKNDEQLQQSTSFSKKLKCIVLVQNEVIEILRKQDHTVKEASDAALLYRASLDLFLTEDDRMYEKAYEKLSPFYNALEKAQCPEFVNFLKTCQKRHENLKKHLTPEQYFS